MLVATLIGRGTFSLDDSSFATSGDSQRKNGDGFITHLRLVFNSLLGSSGVSGRSRQKSLNERIEHCFPSFSSVVNELKEREIERQFLVRDAPLRTVPRSKQ